MKQTLKTGAEFDWTSRWRKIMCYLDRPGVGKSIKRQMNKRFRQEAKHIALAELYETHSDHYGKRREPTAG